MTTLARAGSVPIWGALDHRSTSAFRAPAPARSCALRATSACRDYAQSAASRSRAKAFARPAGRSSPSSRVPIAGGRVFRSPTIPVPAFSPWRRSPIRRLTSAPRVAVHFDEIVCALVHTLKYGDQLDLASTMGRRSLAQAGGELLADADALVVRLADGGFHPFERAGRSAGRSPWQRPPPVQRRARSAPPASRARSGCRSMAGRRSWAESLF